ncbi:MAG: Rpn family recombination-promoting nuclease/putative transposase [bacterium]
MQFLDVKTDFAFKKVFGSQESKDILISFLNAIIDFGEGEKIVDLTIVDPYQIPLVNGMKDSFVDVKAKLSNHKNVIIEMQVLNVSGFEKRILYNAAKSYSTQLSKGEDFTTLEPIIALTITDFVMFNGVENVITYFNLMEKKTLIRYNDEIELIFIELPKFKKDENKLDSIADKWIYFIKNAGKLDYTPKTLEKELAINKAFDIANMAGMSREELEAQHKKLDYIWLHKGAITFALNQGLEQGLEQGREQGIEQGIKQGKEEGREEGKEQGKKEKAIEMAKSLLSLKIDIEKILKVTGLTIDEIEKIKGSCG